MSSRKVFIWLAATSGFLGIGMMFGQAIGNSTDNTPLWIGGGLVILGAVLLGMAISAKEFQPEKQPDKDKKDPK